jgi:uncharacterized protein YjdB
MRTTAISTAVVLLVLGTSGCSSSSQPTDSVAVQGVRVTPQSVVLSAIGETRQLTATIAPVDASDQAITWESSDAGVVSVDADGLVTAHAAGTGVFITAITHDGHHESSVNVSVVP